MYSQIYFWNIYQIATIVLGNNCNSVLLSNSNFEITAQWALRDARERTADYGLGRGKQFWGAYRFRHFIAGLQLHFRNRKEAMPL